jgi:hypothetical protein
MKVLMMTGVYSRRWTKFEAYFGDSLIDNRPLYPLFDIF